MTSTGSGSGSGVDRGAWGAAGATTVYAIAQSAGATDAELAAFAAPPGFARRAPGGFVAIRTEELPEELTPTELRDGENSGNPVYDTLLKAVVSLAFVIRTDPGWAAFNPATAAAFVFPAPTRDAFASLSHIALQADTFLRAAEELRPGESLPELSGLVDQLFALFPPAHGERAWRLVVHTLILLGAGVPDPFPSLAAFARGCRALGLAALAQNGASAPRRTAPRSVAVAIT